jgi:histidine phosphotransfer protein HptB
VRDPQSSVELNCPQYALTTFPAQISLRLLPSNDQVQFPVTIKSDKQSIDLSVLASLRDFQQAGEPDFVTELIDLFLGDTTWQIKLVRNAVAANNVNEFRRLAHLVKGSSGNIGAKKLATICEAMENIKPPAGVSASLLVELENEFERVRILLNKERQW